MSEMRLVVVGAAGRMGRMLVKTIHETSGAALVGAIEHPGSIALGQDAGLLAGIGETGVKITDDPLAVLRQGRRRARLHRRPTATRRVRRARRAGAHRARRRHDRLAEADYRQARSGRAARDASSGPAI